MNVKIEKYKKIGKDKYRIFLDTGEVIDTYDQVILKNNLLIKKEIDISLYNKIFNDNKIQEGYNALFNYINVRIRSKRESYDYLRKKGYDDKESEFIINKLSDDNLIDDNNFTRCFINDKFKFTNWGPYKIRNELKKHNISDELIDKYMISEDLIYKKLNGLIVKQINNNHKYDNIKLRSKIYNSMMNSGFKSSMIIDILNDNL